MGTSGNQILAYQGTEASPSFVFGINFNDFRVWQADATNDQESAIPDGLTNTTYAVAVRERDNGNYGCTVTSGSALILEAICTKNNWNTSNTRYATLGGCGYTCGDCCVNVTWDESAWSGSPTSISEVIIAGN